jgi:hypothetical protein
MTYCTLPVLVDHRHELELALRREGGFGLVEEIDAALVAAEPVFEERQERLAVARSCRLRVPQGGILPSSR